jgi:hypothetical protein
MPAKLRKGLLLAYAVRVPRHTEPLPTRWRALGRRRFLFVVVESNAAYFRGRLARLPEQTALNYRVC